MVGGRNFHKSQFNLAVQGERQAGSAFKPFVLATALSQGISPQTTFTSKPTVINLGDKLWAVHNYENSYLGTINLNDATTYSDNAVYAQLTAQVGPKNIAQMARRLGITSHLNDYFAIGLGVDAVNPLEMARAFATFANGGQRVDGSLLGNRPRAVLKVVDGKRVDRNEPVDKPILDPGQNAILTSMLENVVQSGTGKRAALADRPAAGKTGTTENYGDAWFVGYTPQLVTAVWVGYPNKLVPMLSQFEGRPGRRRNLPGPHLEELRDEGAREAGASRPSTSPRRPSRRPPRARSSTATTTGMSTTATARTAARSCTSPATGRTRGRHASRTRSTCRASSEPGSPTRRRGS